MSGAEGPTLFTIGHSNHAFERFAELLAAHRIEAVADVRSTPYSRRNPQFDRPRFAASLRSRATAYVPLGRELGARAEDPSVYRDGRVDFDSLAATPLFQAGLARLLDGGGRLRVAITCAEKEPLDCHRTLLVTRHLVAAGASVVHILADGSVEAHTRTEDRLMERCGTAPPPLLLDPAERVRGLERAYTIRGRQIAYRAELATPDRDGPVP